MATNKRYRTLEIFDFYSCIWGRIVVEKGVIFEIKELYNHRKGIVIIKNKELVSLPTCLTEEFLKTRYEEN